jgi:hypothetical protein
MNEQIDELLCGLEGDKDESVKITQFNRWVARAIRSHVVPLKEQQTMLAKELREHIHKEELLLAEIKGGLTVVKWLVPMTGLAASSVIIYVFTLLHKAGFL